MCHAKRASAGNKKATPGSPLKGLGVRHQHPRWARQRDVTSLLSGRVPTQAAARFLGVVTSLCFGSSRFGVFCFCIMINKRLSRPRLSNDYQTPNKEFPVFLFELFLFYFYAPIKRALFVVFDCKLDFTSDSTDRSILLLFFLLRWALFAYMPVPWHSKASYFIRTLLLP
jgi:hypothetical protein